MRTGRDQGFMACRVQCARRERSADAEYGRIKIDPARPQSASRMSAVLRAPHLIA